MITIYRHGPCSDKIINSRMLATTFLPSLFEIGMPSRFKRKLLRTIPILLVLFKTIHSSTSSLQNSAQSFSMQPITHTSAKMITPPMLKLSYPKMAASTQNKTAAPATIHCISTDFISFISICFSIFLSDLMGLILV